VDNLESSIGNVPFRKLLEGTPFEGRSLPDSLAGDSWTKNEELITVPLFQGLSNEEELTPYNQEELTSYLIDLLPSLVQRGFDLNQPLALPNPPGVINQHVQKESLLNLACMYSNRTLFQFLISQPAFDLASLAAKGWNIFSGACMNGDTEMFNLLFAQIGHLLNPEDHNFSSLLTDACLSREMEMLGLLFEKEAVMSESHAARSWAIEFACRHTDLDVIKFIINHPLIDLYKNFITNNTLFFLAIQEEFEDFVDDTILETFLVRIKPKLIDNPIVVERILVSSLSYASLKNLEKILGFFYTVNLISVSTEEDLNSFSSKFKSIFEKRLNQPIFKNKEMISLNKNIFKNPSKTLKKLSLKYAFLKKICHEKAAESFASMVLFSDNFCIFNDTPASKERIKDLQRFFNIAKDLPLELQMTLALRQMGISEETIIARREIDPGFRRFLKNMQSSADLA
jgi:ankyrin repeat protein